MTGVVLAEGPDANDIPTNASENNGWDNCTCSCSPYTITGDESETGMPTNAGGPISLWRGAVIEAETDLRLPGPTITLTQKRTYSSMAGAEVDSDEIPVWLLGNKWSSGMITRYLVEVDSSTIDLYLDAASKLRYTLRSGSTTIYDGPDDHYTTLIHIPYDAGDPDNTAVYELFNEQSGEIWIYRDFTTNNAAASRGLVFKRTSQNRPDEEIEFTYCNVVGETNRLSSLTTSQGWTADYIYRDETPDAVTEGKVKQIDVEDASGNVMQRVRYFYKGDPGGPLFLHADVGNNTEDGDLLVVEILTMGSDPSKYDADPADDDFSGYSAWLYRYDGDGRIAGVWEPSAVEEAADGLLDPGTLPLFRKNFRDAVDFLTKSDSDLAPYRTRSYTYYTSDIATTAIATPWDSGANENLNTTYGVSERDESEVAGKVGEPNRETLYRVKTMTQHTGAGGVTRHYYYTQLGSGGGDAREARWVTIVDTEDAADAERYRNIYVMNERGVLLREVFIDTPTSSPSYWCTSYKLGTEGYALNRPIEVRLPSAHTEVDTASELVKFLDPTTNTNDADTVSDSSGRILITEYDDADYDSANGTYTVTQGIKEGENGTINWLGFQQFQKFDGPLNDQFGRFWPVEAFVEPDFGTTNKPVPQSETAGAGEFKPEADDVVTIAYTFHDTEEQQVETRTTTLPSAETGENGSDVRTVTKEYFDVLGHTRWMKDGEDNITYMAYDPDSGQTAYVMQDVETDDLPGDITSGAAGRWVAWDSDPDTAGNQSAIPAGFTNTDNDNLQLVTRSDYDDLARPRKTEDAEGVITYIAYEGSTTRVYPGWDSGTSKPLLPVVVTEADDQGRVLESYMLDPATITIAINSGEPTGLDTGVDQSDYVAWSKVAYNDFFQVTHTDRYFNIPASGDGTAGTNYYRDELRYDDEGRVRYTIKHVSGGATSSAVEQVSRMDYDRLGRVTAMYTGVSGTGHDVATASLDTGLEQISAIYYDQSTPGTGSGGVGDSLVTARVAFNDASDSDAYTETRYHRNWRAQLRGVTLAGRANTGDSETAEGPYLARLTDNLGRTVGSALFQDGSEPTWTESRATWEARFATGAASTGRRTLTRHDYDLLGQRYHTDTYNIAASDGAVLGRVESDVYFDRNGQMVAAETSGAGATEIAYDGAHRAYQSRLVTELEATKYASGAYQYRAPLPTPGTPSGGTILGSGGDDKVLAISHSVLDGVGNVLEAVSLEATHGTTGDNGLNLGSSPKDYVQTGVHYYYDDIHRPTATVNLGTSTDTYTYAALTARAGTAPASSDTKLVTTYTYDNVSRLLGVTDPAGIESRRSYDDLGRVAYSVSNYQNFNFGAGGTVTGTGTVAATGNEDEDLATLRVYNALNQVTELTALDRNGDGTGTDDQTTTYTYGDAVLAHVLAEIKMPDSSGASDVVSFDYHLDGRLDTRTDQRGVVIRTDYDRVLRTLARNVTSLGGSGDVDGAVRALSYTYDNMSRVDRVTSHSATVDVTAANYHTTSVVNYVGYSFEDHHALFRDSQNHGTVTKVSEYHYDETLSGGIYTHALRPSYTVYPDGVALDGRQVHTTYGSSGGVDDVLSRASGLANESGTTANTPGDALVTYTWMGGGTMATKTLDVPGITLDRITPEADGTAPSQGLNGLDRFGRVQDHVWIDGQGTGGTTDDTEEIHIAHGYDRVHRMLYADRQVTTAFSHAYSHDDLHRLDGWAIGVLNRDGSGDVELVSGEASTSDLWTFAAEDHDLDLLHNAVAIGNDTLSDKVTQSVNDANEVEDASDVDRVTDPNHGNLDERIEFDDSSDKDYLEAGPGITNFATQVLVDDSESNALKITTGSTTTPAVVLASPDLGPDALITRVRTPSGHTSGGQAGFVIGYQSALDYWVFVKDFSDGRWKLYHIHDDDDNGNIDYTDAAEKEEIFTRPIGGTTAQTWYSIYTRASTNALDYTYTGSDLSAEGGYPPGRIGLYTEIANIEFNYLRANPRAFPVSLSASWEAYARLDMADQGSGDGALVAVANIDTQCAPTLLRGVRADRFEATFSVTGHASYSTASFRFMFNQSGEGEFDFINLYHDSTSPQSPAGRQVDGGNPRVALSATETAANVYEPTGVSDEVWYRIVSDGTDVTVYSADTEANLATASACFQTTASTDRFDFSDGGGRFGFLASGGVAYIDNFTLKTDRTGSAPYDYETTEHVDTFDLNGSDNIEEDLEYDASGNLTFDGLFVYTYDAFNRLVSATKAYRDGAGDLQTGSTVTTYAYDGQHRRVSRDVDNSGSFDRGTSYYYSGQRVVYETGALEHPRKRYVWGLTYIDELIEVQTVLSYTISNEEATYRSRYALCDTRHCILGLVDEDGDWDERYEYTPYGQRQVFVSSGSNDPTALTPTTEQERQSYLLFWTPGLFYGIVDSNEPLCEYGFQGLRHDEVTGNIYQRAREYSVRMGRFMQRDPLGYPDGMNSYAAYHVLGGGVDPSGKRTFYEVRPNDDGGETLHIYLLYQYVNDPGNENELTTAELREIAGRHEQILENALNSGGEDKKVVDCPEIDRYNVEWHINILADQVYLSSDERNTLIVDAETRDRLDHIHRRWFLYGGYEASVYSPIKVANYERDGYNMVTVTTENLYNNRGSFEEFLLEELVGHWMNSSDEYLKDDPDRNQALIDLAHELNYTSIQGFCDSIVSGPESTDAIIWSRHWRSMLRDVHNITGEPIAGVSDKTHDLSEIENDPWLDRATPDNRDVDEFVDLLRSRIEAAHE